MPVTVPPVGQLQGDGQLLGGAEGHGLLHGQGGDAGGPGQDAAVGHKGAQAQGGQLPADILLVLCQVSRFLEALSVQIAVEQGLLHAPGQQVEEDLLQLPGVDGPPVGGEAHLQPQQQIAVLRVQGAGGPLQHLLAAPADRDEAAVSRALGLKGGMGRPPAKLAGERVLKGDAPAGSLPELPGESGLLSVHMDAQFGGSGKGVPLYVVDGQHVGGELIGAPGVLIGRIALPVDAGQ